MLTYLLQLVDQTGDSNLVGAWTVMAAGWGWAFLFALARLTGLVVLSPVFGQRGVSIWFRIGLAVSLAGVVAPLLLGHDLVAVPSDLCEGAVRLGTEFVAGSLLGFGVLFVFAGLRLAGELIDHQAGVAVQEVFDPSGSGTTTASGQLLTFVGTMSLLCLTPGQGHLQIVATLIDSFASTPTPAFMSAEGIVLWITHVGRGSLFLALQAAAPVLAAGMIVSWATAALSGSAGGESISATVLGVPLRVVLSLFILAAALSGTTDALLSRIEGLLHAFPKAFIQV